MKVLYATLLFALLAVYVSGDGLEDCKCPDGFEAKLDDTQAPKCFGILLKIIQPCNLKQLPHCKCGPEATSVLKDSTGTNCAKFENGKEISRWPCDNKEEFDQFYKENPEYEPSATL